MTEFIIATLLLVPLFIGMTLLARYLDIRSSTVQAARYAAFERATRLNALSDVAMGNQVRDRLFTFSDAALRSTDGLAANAGWRNENPNWTDHSTSPERLIAAPGDITLRTRETSPPGTAGQVATRLVDVIDDVSRISGSRFDVNTRAFHEAQVSVKLADLAALPAPLDRMNVTLTERTSLLADSWHAGSRRAVARRSGALVPTRLFQRFTDVLEPLLDVFSVIEPAFDQLCLGHIDPDIVPEDRLSPLRRGARPSEATRC
jgi:hypothetical protein